MAVTVGLAAAGCFLVTMVLLDVWVSLPESPEVRATHWLDAQDAASRWSLRLGLVASLLVLASGAAHPLGWTINLSPTMSHVVIGVGMSLVLLGAVGAIARTMHPTSGSHRGVRSGEAFLIVGLLTTYLVLLIVSLP